MKEMNPQVNEFPAVNEEWNIDQLREKYQQLCEAYDSMSRDFFYLVRENRTLRDKIAQFENREKR